MDLGLVAEMAAYHLQSLFPSLVLSEILEDGALQVGAHQACTATDAVGSLWRRCAYQGVVHLGGGQGPARNQEAT